MVDPNRPPSSHNEEPTHYASFILRCWLGGGERLRARLVDVNSGVSYPVSNLDQLPHLLGQLLRRMMLQPSASDAPCQAHTGEQDVAPPPTEPDRPPDTDHIARKEDR